MLFTKPYRNLSLGFIFASLLMGCNQPRDREAAKLEPETPPRLPRKIKKPVLPPAQAAPQPTSLEGLFRVSSVIERSLTEPHRIASSNSNSVFVRIKRDWNADVEAYDMAAMNTSSPGPDRPCSQYLTLTNEDNVKGDQFKLEQNELICRERFGEHALKAQLERRAIKLLLLDTDSSKVPLPLDFAFPHLPGRVQLELDLIPSNANDLNQAILQFGSSVIQVSDFFYALLSTASKIKLDERWNAFVPISQQELMGVWEIQTEEPTTQEAKPKKKLSYLVFGRNEVLGLLVNSAGFLSGAFVESYGVTFDSQLWLEPRGFASKQIVLIRNKEIIPNSTGTAPHVSFLEFEEPGWTGRTQLLHITRIENARVLDDLSKIARRELKLDAPERDFAERVFQLLKSIAMSHRYI